MKQTMAFMVESELGLHMRPAASLAQVAMAFQSDIVFSGNNTSANAKSIMSLLLLSAAKGTELMVTAEGSDAADALLAIKHTAWLAGLKPQFRHDLASARL